MRAVIVKERQSIADIALQYCGDVEAVFRISELNDISVPESLSVGMELIIPDVINKRVVDYYTNNEISPATTGEEDNFLMTNEGEYILTSEGEKITINE